MEEIDYSIIEEGYQKIKDNKKNVGAWLECYLSQTPPKFEDCKKYFMEKGMKITKQDYKKACNKMFKKTN
jgi:hypothetical protein